MSDIPPDDDAAVMAQVAAGRHEGFSAIVRRHQQPQLNFFLRSGVSSDAEDLVQQTFLRLYRYRNRYRPRAKFTTFLYLLARQVLIDEIRRRERRKRLHDKIVEQTGIEWSATRREPPDGLSDGLQLALQQLTPAWREVVILGAMQGLEYEEIARMLKIPAGTVKSRMFYGLRALRQALAAGDKDHEI